METTKKKVLIHKDFLKKVLKNKSTELVIKNASVEEIKVLYELVTLVLSGVIPISRNYHNSLQSSQKLELIDKVYSSNVKNHQRKRRILLQIEPALKLLLSSLV